MINRRIYWRRYKKHCTQDNDTSVPFKVGTLGPHTVLPASLLLFKTFCKILCWNRHQLPCPFFLNFICGLKFLFQRWFYFGGKPEVARCQIWAVGGLSHLDDLTFCQKTLHGTWCMIGCIVVIKFAITSCSQLWLFLSYCTSQLTKNIEVVLLINCLSWRGVLRMDRNFPIKKHS